MKNIFSLEKRRQEKNKEIVDRMRAGESLATIDQKATWWPPRPIIKKDLKEIARLYGETNERQGS
jgi:hypothetical protein